ncbi:MAG: nitrate- and nitrite sensing domain-containing protein, partial [Catenulispora sp.]
RIDGELQAIDRLRDLVKSGSPQALSAADFQYHIAIADLLSFHRLAQNSGASAKVAAMLQATESLSAARESLSEEESGVLRTAAAPTQTASALQDLIVGRTGYTGSMESFTALAPANWRGVPDQMLGGAALAYAGQLEDSVAHTPVGQKVQLDTKLWTDTINTRLERLDTVRKGMDQATLDLITKDRTYQRELAGVEAAAVAGTVLLAVVVSLRLGRPIIRGLRGLRDGAHTVAFEDLPAAVQSLRGSDALAGTTPEEFADSAEGGLPVAGDDEIAAVARAFNAVRHEAIRTAAEQELLRAGVGAAFVALARRGERLTGALTLELDKAERDEQDPDRLARLFVLDHLAARMTRNNESLLVLGGEGTARVRDEGVPLVDVIRAASGRIERYSRVDLINVDLGVVVAPPVVDHLVHLCAELLDNATTFSAPDSRVTVDARMMADRIIIQITDRGIGMTPVRRAELNARLTTPTQLDAASVQAMGLTVVGQLASWYGIAVELRPNPAGGTIAEFVLPPTLYWAPEPADSGIGLPSGPSGQNGQNGQANLGGRAPAAAAAGNSGGRRRRSVPPTEHTEPIPAGGGTPRHGGGRTPEYPPRTVASQPSSPYPAPPMPALDATGRPTAFPPAPIRVRPLSQPAGPAVPDSEAESSPWLSRPLPKRVPDAAPTVASAIPGQAAAAAAAASSAQNPATAYPGQAAGSPVNGQSATSGYPSPQTAANQYAAAAYPGPPNGSHTSGRSAEPAYPGQSAIAPYPGQQPNPHTASPYPDRPAPAPADPPAPRPAIPSGPVERDQPPPADPGSAAPPNPPRRTLHGLPKRVPLDRLPAEAMGELPEAVAANPAERDPSRVSASMAAYARGIGGRATGAPRPPARPGSPQPPYTPTSSTGNF